MAEGSSFDVSLHCNFRFPVYFYRASRNANFWLPLICDLQFGVRIIPQANNLCHLGSQPILAKPQPINCKKCLDIPGEPGGLPRFETTCHDIRREAVHSCKSACLAYSRLQRVPDGLN